MPKKKKIASPANQGKYEYRVTAGSFYLKGSSVKDKGRSIKKGGKIFSDDPELHKKLVNKLRRVDDEDAELVDDEEDDDELEEIEIEDSEDLEEEEKKEKKAKKKKSKKNKKSRKDD